ncbi:MAG: TlyA family RNA methyltransferase [Ruminococcaceae bacterium]|nr:TlyA family RNA methyltransferase [Oscillospiraceae bacterium]
MRIDVYLTQYGYAPSRARAQQLIAAGQVKLDGMAVRKHSTEVDEALAHTVEIGEDIPYVGRGGCKLEAALDAFDLNVEGAWALDIGASTGGFTDCLLRRGAARVFAIDSGSGQLAPSLLADPRVTNMEKCNARYLSSDVLGEDFLFRGGADIIVMDVSFISQTYIHPVLRDLLQKGGCAVTLIKPQFEVGREHLGKHGIVREPKWRCAAVERVFESATASGLIPVRFIRSPIEGGDGNVEYLALFRLPDDAQGECLDASKLPAELFGNKNCQ